MEIIFAIVLIALVGIGAWASSGPHCSKHKLTRMVKNLEFTKEDPFKLTGAETKTTVVEWICPRCGETKHIEKASTEQA